MTQVSFKMLKVRMKTSNVERTSLFPLSRWDEGYKKRQAMRKKTLPQPAFAPRDPVCVHR